MKLIAKAKDYYDFALHLTAEPPQVTDNKVKIQKAGFDPVTSFRNPIK